MFRNQAKLAACPSEIILEKLSAGFTNIFCEPMYHSVSVYSNWCKVKKNYYPISVVFRCAQPIFLRLLIATFTNHDPEKWKAYTYAAVICTMSFLNTLFTQPSSFHIMYTGMKFRIATSALVYRKSLRLSKAAENQTNSGYIMNLLANDCTRFDRNFNFLPYMIVAPVQIIILVYLMYQEVGSISFAAVALVILLLPAQCK